MRGHVKIAAEQVIEDATEDRAWRFSQSPNYFFCPKLLASTCQRASQNSAHQAVLWDDAVRVLKSFNRF